VRRRRQQAVNKCEPRFGASCKCPKRPMRREISRLLTPETEALAVPRFATAIETKLSKFPAHCAAFQLFLAAILVRVDALITPSGPAVVILVADAASL
jgi:hypothetical protein